MGDNEVKKGTVFAMYRILQINCLIFRGYMMKSKIRPYNAENRHNIHYSIFKGILAEETKTALHTMTIKIATFSESVCA